MTSSSSSTPEQFNVFKVQDGPVLSDPDLPGTRYHTVIFVETQPDGSGHKHHVTGDLVTGMHYEVQEIGRPEDSETLHDKEFLGTVLATTYASSFSSTCRAQPPPQRQKAFNAQTIRTEPCKPDGTFYEPGEPRPPLFKCTEWTEQRAIPALRLAGIIQRAGT